MLSLSHRFKDLSRDGCIAYSNCFTASVYLMFRHGSSVHLLKILSKVSEENLACPVIGRRVLGSIGCEKTTGLEAASCDNCGVVDICKAINSDYVAKREDYIAALFE